MNSIVEGFRHRQSAHCESGVTAALLSHYGIDCSESQAFGIGDGLFFAYLPFIRVNRLPLIAYRCRVGQIFFRATRRLGVGVRRLAFRSPARAMQALDLKLAENIPVGCQTGAYWLPYFPPAFRFHFNMHNLIVIGKQDNVYTVSDPVFSDPVTIAAEDLARARFAKGALAPSGAMYFITSVPARADTRPVVRTGIESVCRTMLDIPIPLLGVSGIRFLAGRIRCWPARLGEKGARLHLGHMIRMQEEIGTGGGGFRFIYAAFLQEASALLEESRLEELCLRMTHIGDAWRQFAASGARICKGRGDAADTYEGLADRLVEIAAMEASVYAQLRQLAQKATIK